MAETADNQYAYWSGELERAKKRFRTFWENGDGVVDAYRLQKADGNDAASKDKYNILYSSTETIRPNLYATAPKTRVNLRNKDSASNTARAAALLLEGCVEYVKNEEDFDELMDNAVEDYLLPGLGQGWVRYEATIEGEGENAKMLDEMAKIDYVFWQDFLMGVARTWKEVPWVARRIWLNKQQATKRFGAAKADMLKYATRESTGRESDNPSETAEAWEIWDKTTRSVYWFAESMTELLDSKVDPLKLKKFFPCPRPLRAISNTRTLVPRALYSQYKSQAETLNVLTKRIRLLGEALRVVGLYDGSQIKLGDILNPAAGNRMIGVDGWAMFAQNGGITGSVQWVPIDIIVKVLNELLQAREVCKQEIYEITGFSDIVRGVSKASETLGAQNLKANWAGARVKKMQKEVQRFAKDLLALTGEIISEHCSPETIIMFSGIQVPTAEEVQADPSIQAKIKTVTEACTLLHNELRRISAIDIETDSTLLADDSAERDERAKFLAASGAFLQQAVPAMEATPELGPLLGALLMFTVRSFPSARIVEDEFEKVQQALMNKAQQPQDQDKDGKKAKAQADAANQQAVNTLKEKELAIRQAHETAQAQQAQLVEQNRHAEKMLELQVRQQELQLKLGDQQIARENSNTAKFTALHAAGMAELEAGVNDKAATDELEREYAAMADESQHRHLDRSQEADAADADREAAVEAADADREAAAEAGDKDREAQAAEPETEAPTGA